MAKKVKTVKTAAKPVTKKATSAAKKGSLRKKTAAKRPAARAKVLTMNKQELITKLTNR